MNWVLNMTFPIHNKTPTDSKFKLLAIISLLFIAASCFFAYSNPAKGYELSIYDSTPLITWLFMIVSIAVGVLVIVHQIYTHKYKNNSFWIIGFLILVLDRLLFLYLPYIRGYQGWRGDEMSHMGMIYDITSTGHFASDNFYPIIHILPSEIISIVGVSNLTGWAFTSSILYFILYLFSMYLLSTTTLSKKKPQLLAVILVALVNPSWNWPSMSIFLFPLIFYLYFKRSTISMCILFVIVLYLYPFLHVLSSMMAIVALLIIELSNIFFVIISHRNKTDSIPSSKFSSAYILIELTILLLWIFSFSFFNNNFKLLFNQLSTREGSNVIGGMSSTLNKLDVHGFEFVQLLFKLYGVNIIFIIFSVIAVFIVIKQIRTGSLKKETQNLLSLLSVFLFMCFLYFLYLLGFPGLEAIQPTRIMSYIMVFTPIFVGFSLDELSNSVSSKHLKIGSTIIILLLVSLLSSLSCFASPYVMSPNNQITQMDMAGMKWDIEEKNNTTNSVYIMTPPGRFAMEILGSIQASQRRDLDYGMYDTENIPDHFDYANCTSLGEVYSKNNYAVITKLDRVIYTKVWKVIGRFNDSDFEKLEHDSNVSRIYSNGEVDVNYIHSAKNYTVY